METPYAPKQLLKEVYKIAAKMEKNPTKQEDLAQDAIEAIIKAEKSGSEAAKKTLSEPEKNKGYLYTTIRNICSKKEKAEIFSEEIEIACQSNIIDRIHALRILEELDLFIESEGLTKGEKEAITTDTEQKKNPKQSSLVAKSLKYKARKKMKEHLAKKGIIIKTTGAILLITMLLISPKAKAYAKTDGGAVKTNSTNIDEAAVKTRTAAVKTNSKGAE